MLKVQGVTHWSIPVNDLTESEKFYGEVLGLNARGRLPDGSMSCVSVGDHEVLLCQRKEQPTEPTIDQEATHHSFTVTPEGFEDGCRLFKKMGVQVVSLVYREKGFFTGRELYFLDPSGNRLELRDPTWQAGMPKPPYEDIAAS